MRTCTACVVARCVCLRYSGQDPENQLIELRRYATALGWEIVEYIDRATGTNTDREALQGVFQDASRKKFDVVLVWALDRLTREGPLQALLLIKLASVTGLHENSRQISALRHCRRHHRKFSTSMRSLPSMYSPDTVLDGLPEEERDALLRELINNYEGRQPTVDRDMKRKLTAAMQSPDMVLDGLPEEKRDPFRRELIKTFEAML